MPRLIELDTTLAHDMKVVYIGVGFAVNSDGVRVRGMETTGREFNICGGFKSISPTPFFTVLNPSGTIKTRAIFTFPYDELVRLSARAQTMNNVPVDEQIFILPKQIIFKDYCWIVEQEDNRASISVSEFIKLVAEAEAR